MRKFVFLLALLAAGCSSSSDTAAIALVGAGEPAMYAPAPAPADFAVAETQSIAGRAVARAEFVAPAQAPDVVTDRKLIRTGHAEIEVENVETAVATIRSLAAAQGGHVSNEMTQTGATRRRTATVTLRLPADRFDAAVSSLSQLGKVESVSMDSRDVTDQFVDLEVRIANGRRLEQRLLQLIETRAGDLNHVLQAERELSRVRTEIEGYEGRLRLLSNQVELSTLTIQAYEREPIVASHPGESIIGDAFRQAWRNCVRTVAAGIAATGSLLPLLLLALPVLLLVRHRRRRRA